VATPDAARTHGRVPGPNRHTGRRGDDLEADISQWRDWVASRPGVDAEDVDELEGHLRDQVVDLARAGLVPDEAFLIAVKRMGSIDDLSHEFAREYSGRMWRQLALSDDATSESSTGWGVGWWTEVGLWAVAAAVAVQVARLVTGLSDGEPWWLLTNASLLVLPFLAGSLAQRNGLTRRQWLLTAVPFVGAAIVVNVSPFTPGGSTQILVAAHLPVLLWFALARPLMAGEMASRERRMDFVRFSGEWIIYYTLIALGGGVLVGLAVVILEPTGIDEDWLITWALPSGAAGAVVVAAWLVQAKQQVIENMAPVLTMVFTPLFAVMLAGAAVTYAITGLDAAFDRELLGVFDAMMVVVLGLVVYGTSARDPSRPAGWMDRVQLVAVGSALALDVMVLATMVGRIGALGFTPNRVAALGLNLVVLVNLAGAAWLSVRFLAGRVPFHRLEAWQTAYLPVFAMWLAIVVGVLPLLFQFT